MIITNIANEIDSAGIVCDYTNETDKFVTIICASVTAPKPVRCKVGLNAKDRKFGTGPRIVDIIFIGGGSTHSWWHSAGQGLVPGGILKPGERVVVTLDGPGAFRMDVDDGGAAEWAI